MPAFDHTLESIDAIRELIPPPERPAVEKEIDHLDVHCRDWIARSPFVVMASTDADGFCDASPKGGPPGFVRVLDARRLAIPDYPGNRRLDSHSNVLQGCHVQIIFFIPRMIETLRVTGSACLTTDPDILDLVTDDGRRPKLAVGVEVETAFIQCGKSLKRSGMWDPATWPEKDELPRAGRIYADHIKLEGITEEAADAHLAHSYEHELWPEAAEPV